MYALRIDRQDDSLPASDLQWETDTVLAPTPHDAASAGEEAKVGDQDRKIGATTPTTSAPVTTTTSGLRPPSVSPESVSIASLEFETDHKVDGERVQSVWLDREKLLTAFRNKGHKDLQTLTMPLNDLQWMNSLTFHSMLWKVIQSALYILYIVFYIVFYLAITARHFKCYGKLLKCHQKRLGFAI